MNEISARVAQWLESLDQSTRQTLLDLDLQEGDRLPDEFVPGLKAYRVHPVEWKGGVGHIVPGELAELLARLRDE